jgi:hypothetical protein
MWAAEPVLEHNKRWQGKSLRELAEAQGKGIIEPSWSWWWRRT